MLDYILFKTIWDTMAKKKNPKLVNSLFVLTLLYKLVNIPISTELVLNLPITALYLKNFSSVFDLSVRTNTLA